MFNIQAPVHSARSRMKKLICLLGLLVWLSGCSSTQAPQVPLRGAPPTEPELVSILPLDLKGYQYHSFHRYKHESLGFSLRYNKGEEPGHYADIYIWDVPQALHSYSHKEVVYAATNSALREIQGLEQRGTYSKVEFLDGRTSGTETMFLTKQKISLTHQNRALISYLYVSEVAGEFIKARISMPDNKANRNREDVDDFVTELFANIVVAKIMEHTESGRI